MSDEVPKGGLTKIEQQTRVETLRVKGAFTQQNYGFYQPYYPLTHSKFLKWKQPKSLLAVVGAAVLTFVARELLSLVGKLSESAWKFSVISRGDLIVIAGLLVLGPALIMWSKLFSRDRAAVLREIEEWFRDNPERPVIVVPEQEELR